MSSLTPAQTDALTEFLRTVRCLNSLQDDDLRVLIGLAVRETDQAGRDIYRQSDDDKTLYIVYDGRLRLIHIDPRAYPTMWALQAGQHVGRVGAAVGEPHDVTALALTEVVTLVFKRETFMPLREQHPRLWGHLTPQRSGGQAAQCAAIWLAGRR